MKLKYLFCILFSILLFSCEKEEITYVEGSSISYDGEIDGYGYVDLGLPSGLRWATHNLGASLPIESGDCFAWGEISPKSEYTKENCKTYGLELEDISGNSKYDAATYNWGNKWRVPTSGEFIELIDNCSWIYIEFLGNPGFRLTSKKNGKTIFFPCDEYSSLVFYWSSTPHAYFEEDDFSWAKQFWFDTDGITEFGNTRYEAANIRPVSSKPVDISGEIQ